MGYSLCIVAIFGHFENVLIFQILALFNSRFFHRTTLMSLQKRFSHVFGYIIFLTQFEYYAWAIYCLCIVAIFGHF